MPFNTVTLIRKKRSGLALTKEELSFLVSGYVDGDIPDYQISAFLMAVYFKGMTPEETTHFVSLLENSGEKVRFDKISAPKVDKHSTGGIGDKTTFLLGPMLASLGIAYPTMAGRGLAHTGGTIDKFEAIPGFNCELPMSRFKELISSAGFSVIGQTKELCPADKKLYALRDVTGTVESIPLIVASIMSKKLAEGIDAIVFDVKTGSGAFMKSEKEAIELATALVDTAKRAGKLASAFITDMSEPLGRTVGNALEVNECVEFLRQGPQDAPPDERLKEVTMAIAVELLLLAEKQKGNKMNASVARELLEETLTSGKAYAKFLEVVSLQGGDTEAVDSGLPLAKKKIAFNASSSGFVGAMDAEAIGMALVELGGGRRKTTDTIEPSTGFSFVKKSGDKVEKGELIAHIYIKDSKSGEIARSMLEQAIPIVAKVPATPKLIRATV